MHVDLRMATLLFVPYSYSTRRSIIALFYFCARLENCLGKESRQENKKEDLSATTDAANSCASHKE